MTRETNFQATLTQLEELVSKLEEPGKSLEESLAGYEKGMKLLAECQQALQAAKQRVEVISRQGDKIQASPLAPPDQNKETD